VMVNRSVFRSSNPQVSRTFNEKERVEILAQAIREVKTKTNGARSLPRNKQGAGVRQVEDFG